MLAGEDAFLCWPAGGGKTHLMRILAAMFSRCLSLVICTGTGMRMTRRLRVVVIC